MTEISYKDTAGHIESCRKSGFSQAYFIYGEPYLRQRASSAIIEELLPDENLRSVSLDIVDTAEDEGVSDAVERVTTFSFFSGPRVVLLKAPRLMKDAAEKSGQTQEGEGSSKTTDFQIP
ncbi:MAG: hypothetical protein KGY38_05285, partial [Desulfobacterales bacterium]|nr:hypothetical protein [Desulfobacterales bacterium]